MQTNLPPRELKIIMHWLLSISLVGLVTCEMYQSELYKETLGSSNSSLTALQDISSLLMCSVMCLAQKLWCHGFHYDNLSRNCFLYGSCINGYGNETLFAEAALNLTGNKLLAQGKPASISSQFRPRAGAFHGNNGVYPTSDTDLFHTDQDVNPWWRVDMEESHCVWAVYFMNRGYGTWYRARNIMVTVSEMESEIMDNGDNRCGYLDGAAEQFDNLVVCSVPMVGRYVQLQVMAIDFLHFYEVEVHGY